MKIVQSIRFCPFCRQREWGQMNELRLGHGGDHFPQQAIVNERRSCVWIEMLKRLLDELRTNVYSHSNGTGPLPYEWSRKDIWWKKFGFLRKISHDCLERKQHNSALWTWFFIFPFARFTRKRGIRIASQTMKTEISGIFRFSQESQLYVCDVYEFDMCDFLQSFSCSFVLFALKHQRTLVNPQMGGCETARVYSMAYTMHTHTTQVNSIHSVHIVERSVWCSFALFIRLVHWANEWKASVSSSEGICRLKCIVFCVARRRCCLCSVELKWLGWPLTEASLGQNGIATTRNRSKSAQFSSVVCSTAFSSPHIHWWDDVEHQWPLTGSQWMMHQRATVGLTRILCTLWLFVFS